MILSSDKHNHKIFLSEVERLDTGLFVRYSVLGTLFISANCPAEALAAADVKLLGLDEKQRTRKP